MTPFWMLVVVASIQGPGPVKHITGFYVGQRVEHFKTVRACYEALAAKIMEDKFSEMAGADCIYIQPKGQR